MTNKYFVTSNELKDCNSNLETRILHSYWTVPSRTIKRIDINLYYGIRNLNPIGPTMHVEVRRWTPNWAAEHRTSRYSTQQLKGTANGPCDQCRAPPRIPHHGLFEGTVCIYVRLTDQLCSDNKHCQQPKLYYKCTYVRIVIISYGSYK